MLIDIDKVKPLYCVNSVSVCSNKGVIKTDSSGSFKAEFFVQEPKLEPILSQSCLISVDRMTVNMPHSLSTMKKQRLFHLLADTPVFVVDASTVAFTGSVYVLNTPYGSYQGCPVIGATVYH